MLHKYFYYKLSVNTTHGGVLYSYRYIRIIGTRISPVYNIFIKFVLYIYVLMYLIEELFTYSRRGLRTRFDTSCKKKSYPCSSLTKYEILKWRRTVPYIMLRGNSEAN